MAGSVNPRKSPSPSTSAATRNRIIPASPTPPSLGIDRNSSRRSPRWGSGMDSCRCPGAYAPRLLTDVPLRLGIAKEPPEESPSVLERPLTMIPLAVRVPKQHPISQCGFKTTYPIDPVMVPSSLPLSHEARPTKPAPQSPPRHPIQTLLRRPFWPVFLSKSNELKTEDSRHSSHLGSSSYGGPVSP